MGGASRGHIVHLLDAYIANFSMHASPALAACFSGNDMEILPDQRAIRERTLAPPALMASQSVEWVSTVSAVLPVGSSIDGEGIACWNS
jgi:hypothetical protein